MVHEVIKRGKVLRLKEYQSGRVELTAQEMELNQNTRVFEEAGAEEVIFTGSLEAASLITDAMSDWNNKNTSSNSTTWPDSLKNE